MIFSELPLHWSVLFYISEWLIRLLMLVVVIERHPLRSAMAWLLVIFFLPWPGLFLYLFLGENRLPLRRIKKRKRLLTKLEALRNCYTLPTKNESPNFDLSFQSTVALAEKLGYMPIIFNNQTTLLDNTNSVIDRLIDDINTAQTHVHLLFYIFEVDETGQRVINALENAISRGVKCRLLVDAQGSRRFLKKMSPRLKKSGIQLYSVLPVCLLRAWASRIDLRNHRKIAVIDGQIAYTGSQNIVNAGYGHKNLVWHDLMVRLTGPIVLELQAVFVGDWYAESDEFLQGSEIFPDENIVQTGHDAIQTLPSGPLYSAENYQRVVIDAMYAARHSIVITTPYFIPDEAFLEVLETAALKGVKVELITPLISDQILVGNASRAYYERLLKSGVNIHLFNQGLLHVKSMTIDDSLAFIGSSNFDIRSFALNFEINMIFYGNEVTHKLQRIQKGFVKNSQPLSLTQWQQRPRYQKIMQNVIKLLSPVL